MNNYQKMRQMEGVLASVLPVGVSDWQEYQEELEEAPDFIIEERPGNVYPTAGKGGGGPGEGGATNMGTRDGKGRERGGRGGGGGRGAGVADGRERKGQGGVLHECSEAGEYQQGVSHCLYQERYRKHVLEDHRLDEAGRSELLRFCPE